MRPMAQEINAKLAHLADDSQDLANQLAKNKYEIDKLQTQLAYLESPVAVESLKLEFENVEMAKMFDETLIDDENEDQYIHLQREGSTVMLAYTAKHSVYKMTEEIIQMAEFMKGWIPTTLTEFDSNLLEKLRNELREYIYGNASDSESEQQQPI